jgi:hypothetical protein
MLCDNIVFSDHAINQMFKRSISVDDVVNIIEIGEIIQEYPDDKPYPSYLILGFLNQRPLHIVMAKNDFENNCIIVTAYQPSTDIWNTDFKTKKK